MSQVTLRPSSTLATTAMQVVSGASAHAVLADGADADLTGADTTYVHATGSSACTALMGLPDPSWPAGAVTKSFRLRQRGRAASSTPGQGDVKLFKADAAHRSDRHTPTRNTAPRSRRKPRRGRR